MVTHHFPGDTMATQSFFRRHHDDPVVAEGQMFELFVELSLPLSYVALFLGIIFLKSLLMESLYGSLIWDCVEMLMVNQGFLFDLYADFVGLFTCYLPLFDRKVCDFCDDPIFQDLSSTRLLYLPLYHYIIFSLCLVG
ncbi:hypothetical protein Hdeb2414_s0004g00131661 [Helianthus debilis subsp. tardiflorus]